MIKGTSKECPLNLVYCYLFTVNEKRVILVHPFLIHTPSNILQEKNYGSNHKLIHGGKTGAIGSHPHDDMPTETEKYNYKLNCHKTLHHMRWMNTVDWLYNIKIHISMPRMTDTSTRVTRTFINFIIIYRLDNHDL
ncbi:hypothetical protein ACJX0J_019436, partial [Zea mays]